MDTGTHDFLLEASQLIMAIEKEQALRLDVLKIALKKGLISIQQLKKNYILKCIKILILIIFKDY